jgi:hypothetical protein
VQNRWKYTVATVKQGFIGVISTQRLQEALDHHGTLGWELVAVLRERGSWGNAQLVFKRPV